MISFPIHRSLTTSILLAGVPRMPAIVNSTIAAALGIGLHSWFMLPIGIVAHAVCAFACKTDPYRIEILLQHLKEKGWYDV